MRRMYSENQLKELIEEYGLTEEDVIKMLVGKYVRIMDSPAPTSQLTTEVQLTENQAEQMKEGTFINGTLFTLGNPIIYPMTRRNDNYFSIISGVNDGVQIFYSLRLDSSNKLKIYNPTLVNLQFDNPRGEILVNGLPYFNPPKQNNVSSGDVISLTSKVGKAILAHIEVEINGHRCRFESEEESGSSTYVIYSSFGEVSATGKLTANIISYNKSNGEISFNQMTFTPDA